jgi:hypothetical protein
MDFGASFLYKKILIIQVCASAMLVVVVVLVSVTARGNIVLYRKIKTEHDELKHLIACEVEKVRADLYDIQHSFFGELENAVGKLYYESRDVEIISRLSGLQRNLAAGLEALTSLGSESREEEIIELISDKAGYDYTEKGIYYFRQGDYANAFSAFSLALQHLGGNTVLFFYKIYSLYLRHIDIPLSSVDIEMIRSGILELQEGVFLDHELLDFTEAEMRHKLIQMKYNAGLLHPLSAE